MPTDAAPAVTDLDLPARPPAVGAWATDRGVRFRVWAPDARAVALVLGDDAPAWLADHSVAARLVAADGSVCRTPTWPIQLEEPHP